MPGYPTSLACTSHMTGILCVHGYDCHYEHEQCCRLRSQINSGCTMAMAQTVSTRVPSEMAGWVVFVCHYRRGTGDETTSDQIYLAWHPARTLITFWSGGAPTVWHGEWRLETRPTQTLFLRFHCLGPRATDGTERMLTTTFLHGVDVANFEYRGYDYRGRPVHVQRHTVYQISADGQYEELQP